MRVRTLLLWALMGIVPFTNLRMICVDHGKGTRNDVAAPDAECDEFCPRQKPVESDTSETNCVLMAGDCSTLLAALVALPSPQVGSVTALAVSHAPSAASPLYFAPALPRHSPPPKA